MIKAELDRYHLEQIKRPLNFQVGDTVQVHYKIREGNKERIQLYEGIVISINNSGAGKSFIVRRISYDVGVERIFPLHTPMIDKIVKIRSGKVRRASLYYLREKIGKQGRLKEIKRKDFSDKVFEKSESFKKELADKVNVTTKEESVAEDTSSDKSDNAES